VTQECSVGGWVVRRGVFIFFSNRLGCLGSVLVSLAVTVLLIAILRLV